MENNALDTPSPDKKRPVPNKRCAEVEDKILAHVKAGASLSDAPRLEGIDESTFRRWRQCLDPIESVFGDSEAMPEGDRRCGDCANCALHKRSQYAETHFKYECIAIVRKAGETKWQAAAWLLERRHPNEFALKRVIEMDVGNPKNQDAAKLLMQKMMEQSILRDTTTERQETQVVAC